MESALIEPGPGYRLNKTRKDGGAVPRHGCNLTVLRRGEAYGPDEWLVTFEGDKATSIVKAEHIERAA